MIGVKRLLALALSAAVTCSLAVAVAQAPAAAAPGDIDSTPAIFNLDPSTTVGARSIYAATPQQQTALADLETSAIDGIIADHQLPNDRRAVLGWARADVRARMFEQLLTIFKKNPADRSPDEQLDVDWMQSVLQRKATNSALASVAEYNKWSGNTSYTAQGIANPNQPVTYAQNRTTGYCAYHPPAPFEGDYGGRGVQTCYTPCTSQIGCAPPTPSFDQFVSWGTYADDSSVGDPTTALISRDTAVGITYGSAAVAAGLTGLAIGATLGPVLTGTALQLAVFPFTAEALADFGIAEAVLDAGAIFAAALGFVVAVVILALVIAGVEGYLIFSSNSLPDQLNQLVASARTQPHDLAAMSNDPTGARALFSVFMGATEPEPPLLGCAAGAPCVNPPPIPPPPIFLPGTEPPPTFRIQTASGTSDSNYVASRDWLRLTQNTRVAGNWFVTDLHDPVTGQTVEMQSLRWRYVDWNGQDWTAWLVKDQFGFQRFLSVRDGTDWAPGSEAQPCTASQSCVYSTSLQLLDPNQTRTTVTLINTPPVATGDAYTYAANTDLIVPAPGVRANDSESDGQPVFAVKQTNPSHGDLVYFLADGSFRYRPNAGYTGPDEFTYVTENAAGILSAPVTVSLTVGGQSPNPVAVDDTFHTTPGVGVPVPAPGLLGNDSDPNHDAITPTVVTAPAHGFFAGGEIKDSQTGKHLGWLLGGTVSIDGSFTYVPDDGFTGTDTFTYQVYDTGGRVSQPATVSITVANPPPTATASPPEIHLFTPTAGQSFELGSIVPAQYFCTSPFSILLCLGNSPAGAPIDTFSLGTHPFTVVALDNNFFQASTSLTYTVVDTTPPTATITAPADGAVYTAGQVVQANYVCADWALADCTGTVPNGTALATATTGPHTFTATGTDSSGNHATTTVHYTVVAGAPATVAATSGSGQSATTHAAFGAPLVATVTDALGNPVPNYAVVFNVASGSAKFATGASATVQTDALGAATSPALTAGGSAGPVTVTASSGPVSGSSAAGYLEAVTAPPPAKADVVVRMSAPAKVAPGGSITVTVNVRNAGPDPAGRYAAALLLPSALTVRDAGGGKRYHSAVVFTGSALGVGQSVTYTVVLKVAATAHGSVALAAIALSGTADPHRNNNVVGDVVKIG